jgi:CRP-like cAMP-binding protein
MKQLGLRPAELAQLLQAVGRPRRLAKGELLISAGDPSHGFYYIKSGEVRVYKMDARGREVEVARLGPGEFLGEAAVFASPEFFVFAETVVAGEALYFAKDDVFKKIDQNPVAARLFLRLLAEKCIALNRKIESLGLQTVRQRLAAYLLTHCPGEKTCAVELKMTKGELAKLLDTAQETLSRTLKHLKQEGLVEVRGSRFLIKDCHRLRRVFEE